MLQGSARRLSGLAGLALFIMLPVTLPVPVLRELVHDRFAVSELLASLFMSVNMVGALLTAPLAGALVDRLGRRRGFLVAALGADGLCFLVLTAPRPRSAPPPSGPSTPPAPSASWWGRWRGAPSARRWPSGWTGSRATGRPSRRRAPASCCALPVLLRLRRAGVVR
jgi:hypothetical protein